MKTLPGWLSLLWEPLLTAGAFVGLQGLGLIAAIPLWVLLGTLVLARGLRLVADTALRGPERWQRYVSAALHVAGITTVVYATGWGPALTIGYVFAAAGRIRLFGASAVLAPMIVATSLGVVAGQAALQVGLAPSLLPLPLAHGLAVLTLLGTLFAIRLVAALSLAREQASTALADSEERWRSLFEHHPDAVFALDIEGVFISVNEGAANLSGYSREELLGNTFAPYIQPEDFDRARWHLAQVLEGRAQQYELTIRHKDGHSVHAAVTNSPMVSGGRIVGMYGLAHDLSERDQAEAERARREWEEAARAAAELQAEQQRALAEERAHYEATAVNLTDGLAILDRDARVRFWNPRLEQLFGVPASDAQDRPTLEVEGPVLARTADPAAARRLHAEALAQALGGTPATAELHLTGDGARELLVRYFPIQGPDGLMGCGQLVRDVTEERALARMKDELVATVSHELRTPLAALVGFTELLLKRDWPEAERKEFLETMHREGLRLTKLINDFLDLQRLATNANVVVPRPIDLVPLMQEAVDVAVPDTNHPIIIDVPGTLPRVLGDPDRLLQVLASLLSNARKYSPEGGAITVRARTDERQVEASVVDQGLGISSAALPRIFDRFYRVRRGDRREIGGTGLGLAITKTIVDAHGGQIWAESPGDGRGSTFRFTLPLAREPAVADVLIVEDNQAFAGLVGQELSLRGYTVAYASNAETALEMVKSATPRAVVLDLGLPGMAGEAFLKELRMVGRDPPLPVVVVTVADMDFTYEQSLEKLGAGAVIRKGPTAAAAAAGWVEAVLAR